jgi:outer membrane protein assembly factor BamB
MKPGNRIAIVVPLALSLGASPLVVPSQAAGALGVADWTTFHFDNARTGVNPFEGTIGPSNVQALSLKWVGMNMGGLVVQSSPVVSNGVVYVADSWLGKLWAFDTECGSHGATCNPLWSGRTVGTHGTFSGPAVAGGVVFVASADHFLYAFDAAGCGSSECDPLWVGQMSAGSIGSSAAVSDGKVYVGTFDDHLFVFDAAGCGQPTCAPLWVGAAPAVLPVTSHGFGSPAIANGVVYVNANSGRLYAYPAQGCGRQTCGPLWIGQTDSLVGTSGPAVANGVVYMGVDQGLVAFSAAGCGQRTCRPLWTGKHGFDQFAFGTPAIWNGKVYLGIGTSLEVFAASGCGAPTCGPLFIIDASGTQAEIDSSPAVANGIVYVGENSMKVFAGNANGCGQPFCSALWTGQTDSSVVNSSPAVVDGVLYIGSGNRFFPDDQSGRLYAFSLNGN